MDILIYALISCVAFILGWIVRSRFKNYGGAIVITLDPETERTMFSLELFDDIEQLISEKQVLFRVDTSEENGDRI